MHFSQTKTAAILTLALTTTTTALPQIDPSQAQQLYIVDGFEATDQYLNVNELGLTWNGEPPQYEWHIMNFNVSRPNTVPQAGGDGVYHCRVEWQGCEPPSCYTECTSTGVGISGSRYWTRVTPGQGRKKAVDISVDVLQYYSYKNSVVNNGTFSLKNKETGSYTCVNNYYRGTLTQWCEFKEEPKKVDVGVELLGYGIYPIDTVAEICGSG